ncbi:hypothetical protein [Brevibacillus porteri]|uniref:hypothetical protein n=1 Tax=Brevibacillus porteri TaxID=2126350 RepID=UPI003D1CBF0E
MPVPATTGQLRENVLDMEIGDYIVMKVTSTGLHEFGGTTASYTETPVNGTSNQNGAFQAFDGKLVGAWKNVWYTNGESAGWLAYEFPDPKIVRKYMVICGDATDTPASSPKEWIRLGWGQVESTRLCFCQTNWSGSQKRHFLIDNNTPYSKYRINVFSNNGSAFLSIGELEMFEFGGIMRSLTGGVANVDEKGHLSHIDKNKGGWPTNNEWDKYIVNFPIDKIQPGKTLDDVFHWNVGVATWCQETPVTGTRHHDGVTTGASGHRIWRGSANANGSVRNEENYSNFSGSSISSTTIGYRPLFEYREK